MRKKNKGFTLIELMIVVVIIAVLVGVAVVAYTRHIKKGRIVKEKTFVANIQAMQETYFQQSGFYLNVTSASYDPGTTPSDKVYWTAMTKLANWNILGAKPEAGVTYMQWDVTASAPTAHALTGSASTLGLNSGVPWYYIHGRGNFGGSSTVFTEFFATSQKTEIWTQHEGE